MINFNFDRDTALASMLYIAKASGGVCDKYNLLKTLYFADKLHLVKYGRPITGDNYISMKYGPVPSKSFDIIRHEKNDLTFLLDGNQFTGLAEPDLDYLSETDIEVLDAAILETKHLGFVQLMDKSHDEAYNKTCQEMGLNASISFDDMASAGGVTPTMLEYIKMISENQNCNLNGSSNW